MDRSCKMRIQWIDLLRGFCMIAILWFHTEMYFAGYDVTPYAMYVGNVLAVFFFLSGYLLYHKDLIIRNKIYSIFRKLIVPYFFFTSIIAFPKALVYHHSDLSAIITNIICGYASWFIAALIVSELMFIIILHYFKKNIIEIISMISIIMLILSYLIGNNYNPSSIHYEDNLWHINESLLGFFFLSFGYIFRHFENKFSHIQLKFLPILIILFIVSKLFIYKTEGQFIFGPIMVSNFPLFVIDLIIGILLLVIIFKQLPSNYLIQWTGSHSIVYYFICGGVPLITSKLFNMLSFTFKGYFSIIIVFLVVYVISTIITWIIYKYLPAIIDYHPKQ